jgi:IclR family transcriptional regulator, mhp operon transcriptional activator
MAVFDPVTAVVRALDVLRLVNRLEHASVTEIHKQTEIPKATVLRMIETLVSCGYVTRVRGMATYAATGRCLLLSNGFQAHARVIAAAGPLLGTFRKKIGWPSDFGIFDKDAMVIAVTSREFGVMSLNRKAGERTPLLLSALGRAYFAFCEVNERERILEVLRSSTNPLDKAAKNPTAARRMLDETKAQGFSLTDKGYLDTVYEGAIWGIGVPVIGAGRVLAAMNVMFLRNAMSLDAGIKSLVPALKRAAAEIGRQLADNGMLTAGEERPGKPAKTQQPGLARPLKKLAQVQ